MEKDYPGLTCKCGWEGKVYQARIRWEDEVLPTGETLYTLCCPKCKTGLLEGYVIKPEGLKGLSKYE